MPTFLMMTRLNSEGASSGKGVVELERSAMSRVRSECPGRGVARELRNLRPL